MEMRAVTASQGTCTTNSNFHKHIFIQYAIPLIIIDSRLHNEELHSLYRSPNIVKVIKSRSLRWAGHVARMEEGRSAFKIYQVNLQERDL